MGRHWRLLLTLLAGLTASWFAWRVGGVVPRYSGYPWEEHLRRFVDDPGLAPRRRIKVETSPQTFFFKDSFTNRVLHELTHPDLVRLSSSSFDAAEWGEEVCCVVRQTKDHVAIWDFRNRELRLVHELRENLKFARLLRARRRMLIHEGQELCLYDTSKNQLIKRIPVNNGLIIDRMVSNGCVVVTGMVKSIPSVIVYDLATGEEAFHIPDIKAFTYGQLFDRSERYLVVCLEKGRMQCWDVEQKKRLWQDMPTDGVMRATRVIMEDGSACLVQKHDSQHQPTEYQLLDLKSGTLLRRWAPRYRFDHPILSSTTGKRVYSIVGYDRDQESWSWLVTATKWVKAQLKIAHHNIETWPRIDDWDTGEVFEFRGAPAANQPIGITADGQFLVLERPGPVWDVYSIPGDRPWGVILGWGAGVGLSVGVTAGVLDWLNRRRRLRGNRSLT